MMRIALVATACFSLLVTAQVHSEAFPEPAVVSPSWALEFTYETPRPIAVRQFDGSTRWYWYMPYMVVNRTGEDRLFVPEITIATDTGNIFPANFAIPASVFDRVKEQENNRLLLSPFDVVGDLLQGTDYAKESVAIWPAFTDDVDQFSVFFSGLSGETASFSAAGDGEDFLLRRTTMLIYATPGNHPMNPQNQPISLVEERDVMR